MLPFNNSALAQQGAGAAACDAVQIERAWYVGNVLAVINFSSFCSFNVVLRVVLLTQFVKHRDRVVAELHKTGAGEILSIEIAACHFYIII